MLNIIIKLFKKSAQHENVTDLPEFNFENLKNNFSKRSYSFDEYRKRLSPESSRLLHWIGTIDYSGYQREKSLTYLINNYSLGDENRILLRLEDWVDCVQKLAEDWVISNFNNLSLEEINNQHKLILYLTQKEKVKQSQALIVINKKLLAKASKIYDREFHHLDTKLRRYIYHLQTSISNQYRKRILFDKDPFNRIILINRFDFEELSENELTTLKSDKSSFVKRKLFYSQLNSIKKPDLESLKSFCLDDNKGIRDLGKFWIKKLYEINPYTLYKNQLDEKKYFIADFAKKEDLEIFIEGFQSKDKKIKNICFKAICSIDNSLLKRLDPSKLISANKKIRKLTVQHLPEILTFEELKSLKEKLTSVNSKGHFVYLNIIHKKSVWFFLLEALDLLETNSAEETIIFVKTLFFKKSYTNEKLNSQLKSEISKKIDTLKNNNNFTLKDLIKEIEFRVNTS